MTGVSDLPQFSSLISRVSQLFVDILEDIYDVQIILSLLSLSDKIAVILQNCTTHHCLLAQLARVLLSYHSV